MLGAMRCERIGWLPERMARSRRNPMAVPLREITLRIGPGKTIRLVTNDLDSPAEEIAELYRQRWQIELFSSGSSRTCASGASSEPPRTPYASRSTSR
jgi:hypothetical protein